MRWVNEILPALPADWSPWLKLRRRSSSTPTGRTRKVVAVGTVRLSVMLATSLAAGPLMAEAPAGMSATGAELTGTGAGGIAAATAARGSVWGRVAAVPLPSGRSPTTPLSNSRRHSGPTAAGSRRNSSYIAWANPALAVSNTLKSTTSTIPARERAKRVAGTGPVTLSGECRKITVGRGVGMTVDASQWRPNQARRRTFGPPATTGDVNVRRARASPSKHMTIFARPTRATLCLAALAAACGTED